MGALRPLVTLFAARARPNVTRRGDAPVAEPVGEAPQERPAGRGWRRLPRFLAGTLTGVTAGIAMGIAATALVAVTPGLSSTVLFGAAEEPALPETATDPYVARVMAQAMNPTLIYADEATVAALTAKPAANVDAGLVGAPIERELRDNATVIVSVLAALTLLSWGVIMWGLSGGSPKVAKAG